MEQSPIADLRRKRADLFEAPGFWRTTLEDIAEAASAVENGAASIIGKSAGGRDILSFSYGAFEPQTPTATISSAMASDRPQAFFDPADCTGPPWSFYFQTFFHHASGALPLLFELPHGIRECYYPLENIIDIGLTAIESWLDFSLRFGLRPRAMDFYGTPPPA